MKAYGLLFCVMFAVAVACVAAAPDGAPPAAPAVLTDVPDTPDLDEALQIPVAERKCNHRACDDKCVKRGFGYGNCGGFLWARCYCYR